jgi:two-component system sensor histidine kinase KdpD
VLLDVLFVPPHFNPQRAEMQHVVTFGVMLLVAIVVGADAAHQRPGRPRRAERAAHRVLTPWPAICSRTDDPEGLARLAVRHVERRLDARVVLRTKRRGAAAVADEAAAEPVADGAYRLELRAATAPSSPLGSLTLFPRDPARLRDPEERRLAEAFANQLAVALERARLAREAARARVQIETERLRSTLLSAISHDSGPRSPS